MTLADAAQRVVDAVLCPECKGKGRVLQQHKWDSNGGIPSGFEWVTCPLCDGEGINPEVVLSQYEMWQVATHGSAGDGTEEIPVFIVVDMDRAVPVGASGIYPKERA